MASISRDPTRSSTEARGLTSEFFKDLKYTNKLMPNRENRTSIKIAKWAVIILTLGLIFIIPLTIDYSKRIFNKIFGRQNPPIIADLLDDNPLQIPNPPIIVLPTTSQKVVAFLSNIFTKENAKNTLLSAWEGITILPKKATKCFEREDNTTSNKIGLALGITAPFWLASGLALSFTNSGFIWRILGGFTYGSAASLLYTGGSYGVTHAVNKIHNHLITPPQTSNAAQPETLQGDAPSLTSAAPVADTAKNTS